MPAGRTGWHRVGDFETYLAQPAGPLVGAVLLVHPWWGANGFITRLAERLASEGFIVSAPDYYEGKIARTEAAAEGLRDALDMARAERIVGGALRHLAGLAQAKAGIVCLSLGCQLALAAAADAPDLVGAMVLFYGTGEADLGRLSAPMLGHFAGDDPFEPREWVDAFRASLAAGGGKVDFHIYAGTGHWFFEDDRDGFFDEQAAERAWERTVEFLRRYAAGSP
jgi:carboxymethylenebutenolidase